LDFTAASAGFLDFMDASRMAFNIALEGGGTGGGHACRLLG